MQSNGSDSEEQPQTHWVGMQYPPPAAAAAAMVMQQQQMMHPLPPPPPQYYMPFHYRYQQQRHYHNHSYRNNAAQQQQQQESDGDNKTVWIGDLQHWMDEAYLRNCFASNNQIVSIKVIRNRHTGFSEGYGFVEFDSHDTAKKVLESYPKLLMPDTEQYFNLNWASYSSGDKRSDNVSDHSIFVGDLAADVTDNLLHETFASKYPSVKSAKVVVDANTGHSKGYGFVRFGDDSEKSKAMTEMNGEYCSSRPMRIGAATPRKSSGFQQQYSSRGEYASNGASYQVFHTDGDHINTTVFVGRLDRNVTDEDLRQLFSQYGEIVSVKIPAGKGCGFVKFVGRDCAEEALQKLNGTVIGNQAVSLSWGRSPANKQFRADYGNQWTGAYYGSPYYDPYGYALPSPHGPSMYPASPYGAYPMYGSFQQQVS